MDNNNEPLLNERDNFIYTLLKEAKRNISYDSRQLFTIHNSNADHYFLHDASLLSHVLSYSPSFDKNGEMQEIEITYYPEKLASYIKEFWNSKLTDIRKLNDSFAKATKIISLRDKKHQIDKTLYEQSRNEIKDLIIKKIESPELESAFGKLFTPSLLNGKKTEKEKAKIQRMIDDFSSDIHKLSEIYNCRIEREYTSNKEPIFDYDNFTITYKKIIYSLQNKSGNKFKPKVFETLWSKRSIQKRNKEGEKMALSTLAMKIGLIDGMQLLSMPIDKKQELKRLIKDSNRYLNKKRLPIKIDTQGGVQIIITV